MATRKYLSYDRLQEYDILLKEQMVTADDSALSSANEYTDTKIAEITNGTTVVKEAEHAIFADSATSASSAEIAESATKATQDGSGNVITTTYETKIDAKNKLDEAKTYADTAAATVKDDLLNGAGEAYDTLKELGDLIDDNKDAIDALEIIASGKADAEHTHDLSAYETKEDSQIKYDELKEIKSDWNQNDETAPDYIKNRICYVTDPVDYVLLEEQAIIFDDTLSYFDDTATLETGDGLTYVVTFDNTVYECLLTDIGDGNVYIGNGSLNSDEYQDTGEPFYVSSYVSEYGMVILTSTVGEHSISIIKRVNDIVKIDEKFLPATVGKDVSGQTFTEVWDGTEYVEMTADIGAEIFNDYENNIAIGYDSHAEGYGTTALGDSSHAEGERTVASGDYSHAEGNSTKAFGGSSHSEGSLTVAIGYYSHAEGMSTEASGISSHSEGDLTVASGDYSHSEGYYTKASSDYQHVQGRYNIEDTANTYAHIIGNGADISNLSNAHTLDWDGNAWFSGNIKIGGTGYDDENAKIILTATDELITIDDIDEICGSVTEGGLPQSDVDELMAQLQ